MLFQPSIFTTMALASAVCVLSTTTAPPCTTTATYTESECCPQYAAHTAWEFPDCGGCELEIETVPLNCFAPCTASPTTDPAKTTTLMECEQTFSILPVTVK